MKSLVFLLFIVEFAVAQQPKSAIDYNEYIVNEQNKIGKLMIDFSKSFGKGEVEKMNKKHKELIFQIDASLLRLKELKPFKGNADFRDKSIKLFELYRSICANEYLQIMEIYNSGDNSQRNIDRLNTLLQNIQSRETPVNEAFLEAQKQFSITHKFKLAGNKYEEELKNSGSPENPSK